MERPAKEQPLESARVGHAWAAVNHVMDLLTRVCTSARETEVSQTRREYLNNPLHTANPPGYISSPLPSALIECRRIRVLYCESRISLFFLLLFFPPVRTNVDGMTMPYRLRHSLAEITRRRSGPVYGYLSPFLSRILSSASNSPTFEHMKSASHRTFLQILLSFTR